MHSTPAPSHGFDAASPWVQRWSQLLAPSATVLDVACGGGRHVRWFAQRGHAVTALDRDERALDGLRSVAEVLACDLEGSPWPLAGRRFGAVVVTNYLWRPLFPSLIDALDEGGVLICETFAVGQGSIGKPSNPDFLLRPQELLEAARGLRVVAYEDGFVAQPPRFVQRLAAVREPARVAPDSAPARYLLTAAD